ncbi:MAG: hypothetical protein ACHRXM_33525 [Isosphaerales bacterium]
MLLTIGVLALLLEVVARSEAGGPSRFEFTRVVAHWAEYENPDYLKFIELELKSGTGPILTG